MDCAHYECHRLWAQLVAKTRRNFHVLCHDLVIDRHRTDYSSSNIHPNCMNLHRIIPLIILYRMRLFSWKSTTYSKRYSLLSVAISNRHGQFFRRRAKNSKLAVQTSSACVQNLWSCNRAVRNLGSWPQFWSIREFQCTHVVFKDATCGGWSRDSW